MQHSDYPGLHNQYVSPRIFSDTCHTICCNKYRYCISTKSYFFGQSFEPGHPLYDNRSWVIQHHRTEISAISWLDTNKAKGYIENRYLCGVCRTGGLSERILLSSQSAYPFIRDWGYSQHADTNTQQHYLLILSRMKSYTEFGIQWLQKKEPLTDTDLRRINNECNILYTNGNANVYSYFSNVYK